MKKQLLAVVFTLLCISSFTKAKAQLIETFPLCYNLDYGLPMSSVGASYYPITICLTVETLPNLITGTPGSVTYMCHTYTSFGDTYCFPAPDPTPGLVFRVLDITVTTPHFSFTAPYSHTPITRRIGTLGLVFQFIDGVWRFGYQGFTDIPE